MAVSSLPNVNAKGRRQGSLPFTNITGIQWVVDVLIPPETAFLLAYGTRFLYPVGLPRMRTAPAVILAGQAIAFSSGVDTGSREENASEL
jgi:hypothetical protein